MSYLYMAHETAGSPPVERCRYDHLLWRPTFGQLVPAGLALWPFGVWSVMSALRLFANDDYHVLVIYDAGRPIHRSLVTPRYFRFPFMESDDLQIGDVWTHPDYRRQGLAGFAFRAIMAQLGGDGRRFWYIVEESNAASIAAAQSVGFRRLARGRRTRRLGIRLLGSFDVNERLIPERSPPPHGPIAQSP